MLILYDLTNYFGAHGNIETLSTRFQKVKENHHRINYFPSDKDILINASSIIVAGFEILKVFNEIFYSRYVDFNTNEELFLAIEREVKNLKIEILKVMGKKKYLDDGTLTNIYNGNKVNVDKQFDEYIKREKKRKGSSQ